MNKLAREREPLLQVLPLVIQLVADLEGDLAVEVANGVEESLDAVLLDAVGDHFILVRRQHVVHVAVELSLDLRRTVHPERGVLEEGIEELSLQLLGERVGLQQKDQLVQERAREMDGRDLLEEVRDDLKGILLKHELLRAGSHHRGAEQREHLSR